MTYKEIFAVEIAKQLKKSIGEYTDLNSGDIHREVGGYPGKYHHMPSCCQAMYDAMSGDDTVLTSPASGKGASLTIRYYKRNH